MSADFRGRPRPWTDYNLAMKPGSSAHLFRGGYLGSSAGGGGGGGGAQGRGSTGRAKIEASSPPGLDNGRYGAAADSARYAQPEQAGMAMNYPHSGMMSGPGLLPNDGAAFHDSHMAAYGDPAQSLLDMPPSASGKEGGYGPASALHANIGMPDLFGSIKRGGVGAPLAGGYRQYASTQRETGGTPRRGSQAAHLGGNAWIDSDVGVARQPQQNYSSYGRGMGGEVRPSTFPHGIVSDALSRAKGSNGQGGGGGGPPLPAASMHGFAGGGGLQRGGFEENLGGSGLLYRQGGAPGGLQNRGSSSGAFVDPQYMMSGGGGGARESERLALNDPMRSVAGVAGEADKQTFTCNRCGTIFLRESYLVRHMRTSHPEVALPTYEFSGDDGGGFGERIIQPPPSQPQHPQQQQQQQQQQHARAEQMFALENISVAGGGEPRAYQCTRCSAAPFSSAMSLEKHTQMVHEDRRPHSCKRCDFAFTTKNNLEKHVRTVHEKIRPFRCEVCTSAFDTRNNLMKHTRTVHNKDRPFHCVRCSNSFGQKSHLDRHVRTVHDNIRPYPCNLCTSTFGRKSHLNVHVRTVHENMRPYRCNECGANFGEKGTLTTHIRRIHKGDPQT